MVVVSYLEPGRSPPVSPGEPWLHLYAKTDALFFGKGAAGSQAEPELFEVAWEQALPRDECIEAARAWAERHGVRIIWIQPCPTVQHVYRSPDGVLELIDESVPDDTLYFAGSDWHVHGYMLAESAGLGESPEQARERFLSAILADELDIVVETREGQPYIWIAEEGETAASSYRKDLIVRRWTR